MIYTIFADGNLLYSSQYANDERAVINPTLKVEMGKAGALDFTLLPTHYLYTQIHEMLTEVTVACDGYELFRGRVTKVTDDFFRHRKVSCEGDLAYLLDTVTYKITDTFTPRTLLQFCIDCHNSQLLDDNNELYCESDAKKLFVVGDVTIDEADETVSIEMSSNQSTMQTIEGFLVNVYGGFLKTRYDDGKTYLDYVKDYNYVNNQPIRFGFNMQSMEKSNDAKDLYTVLMPIGSDDLTIDSVNDGSPFIEMPGLVAKYGRIIKTHTFDNVTEPRRLLQKAQKYITDNMPGFAASETFKIKAVDMHMFDGSIDQIVVGDVVQIVSEPHGVDVTKECLSISYKLEDPSNNEYEFGVPDQTKEQKDAKASKKISSGLGYSARSAAAEVKTVSSDVKSLGTQMAKGLEDTLDKIDKNKTDIETALATAKAELNQNIANNKELIDKNAENIETNTGEIEEAFNTISSNKTSIESALETAKTNLKNLIDDNTASINKNTADIETNTGDIEEAFNTISSNKTSIESALEQTKSDFNERIKTKADKGSLIQQINESQETQTINQGKIKLTPDAVINAVNGGKDSDRTDIIKPDKIQLGSGNEKLSDKIQLDSNNNVTLQTLLVGTTGSFITLSSGSATAPTLSTTAGGKVRIVGSGTTQYYDLDASNVGKLVTDIQVIPSGSDSNEYQLQQKTIGNPSWANVSPNGTFSRATSLRGTWSGANLTVTANPQGETYEVYHRVGLKGPTGGSQPGVSFSIVMEAQTEQDTSGYVERGSSYGYLALVGSGANANVVVGPNRDGSVFVGMLPVGSLYTTGKTDGETRAKNSVLRAVEWEDDGTNVDLSLNYSDDSTEIWTVTDDSNKIANSLSLSDDVALDTSTNHVKGYAYVIGSGQDSGYYIKRRSIDVDVSNLVTDATTAGKNSAKVTGPTWSVTPSSSVSVGSNTATFTTDAVSPSSSTPKSLYLFLSRSADWTNNVRTVYLTHTNSSEANRVARIDVDASNLVSEATTAGKNSAKVTGPTWSVSPSSSVSVSSNTATFTTDAASPSSSTPKSLALYLSRSNYWANDVRTVYLTHTSSSEDNRVAKIDVAMPTMEGYWVTPSGYHPVTNTYKVVEMDGGSIVGTNYDHQVSVTLTTDDAPSRTGKAYITSPASEYPVAELGIGSWFVAGETRAKNSVLRSVEWQDDGTNVDLLLNYSDDSTEIWTVTDDSNKIANSLSLSDDVALDTSTNHVKGYAYVTGSGQDVGYYIKRSPIDVDVSSLVTDVTAAKNSVKVTGPTWQIAPSPSVIANYNIATFTTDAPSPSSSTPRSMALYILRAEEWVGNAMYVYLNHTNNSDTNRLARIKVDASDLVSDATTAGRNSVTVYAPTCGNSTPEVASNAVRTTINIKAVASNTNSNNSNFTLQKGTYTPVSGSNYHCVDLKEGSTVIGRCSVQDIYTTGKSDGFGVCHDSIGLSESSQTLSPGGSVTIYPTAKSSESATGAANITEKGITITASSSSSAYVTGIEVRDVDFTVYGSAIGIPVRVSMSNNTTWDGRVTIKVNVTDYNTSTQKYTVYVYSSDYTSPRTAPNYGSFTFTPSSALNDVTVANLGIQNQVPGIIRGHVIVNGTHYYGKDVRLTNSQISSWGGPVS